MSKDLIYQDLTNDEGDIAHVYQDSEGYWTIGIGFLVDKRLGGGLLPEERQFILKNRVRLTEEWLNRRLPFYKKLSPNRQRALINMGYNLGETKLLKFHNTLRYLELGEYEKAAEQALKSKWAKQVGKRAVRIAELIKNG